MKLPVLPYNAILFRYSEIAIKGKNRWRFENILIQRLNSVLSEMTSFNVVRERGRISIVPIEQGAVFTASDLDILRSGMTRIFGLASASPCLRTESTIDAVTAAVDRSFPPVIDRFEQEIPRDRQIQYAMRARKNNRSFPISSNDLEIMFADRLLPAYPRLEINLKHPELRIEVEVRKDYSFISYEHIAGPGGLPTGTSGRVLALLSGGIDSPVACHQMMRRGCTVDFLTFHSTPYTPPGALRKIARLAGPLSEYQGCGQLFAVNLLESQKAIRSSCSERFRTVLYRRLMVRIAQEVARYRGAKALVTGENLGQVASQTLQNLTVIEDASDMPILRPLLAFDKQDIVALARSLDLLDISNEPMPDSCTVFAPANPSTNSPRHLILQEEEKLDIPALVEASLAAMVTVDLNSFAETPMALDARAKVEA